MNDPDLAPVAAPSTLAASAPVVDLGGPHAETVRAIAEACESWGFFQLVGHGIGADLTAATRNETRRFFDSPRTEKRAVSRTRENPWGYYDRELTKNARDKKEVFDVGPDIARTALGGDPFQGATPWPSDGGAMERALRLWFAACESVSERLLHLIGEGLGGGEAELRAAFQPASTSFLRLNHYPVEDPLADEAVAPADLGIHHHTDAGALTLLLQDEVPGLQVLLDGAWRPVDPLPGAFTVNIGDMVQVWSNDRFRAPLHRVQAMERVRRFSIPFFYNPAYDAVIRPISGLGGPPRYRGFSWGEFRRRRAEGDFADYGAEVQIGDFRIG